MPHVTLRLANVTRHLQLSPGWHGLPRVPACSWNVHICPNRTRGVGKFRRLVWSHRPPGCRGTRRPRADLRHRAGHGYLYGQLLRRVKAPAASARYAVVVPTASLTTAIGEMECNISRLSLAGENWLARVDSRTSRPSEWLI